MAGGLRSYRERGGRSSAASSTSCPGRCRALTGRPRRSPSRQIQPTRRSSAPTAVSCSGTFGCWPCATAASTASRTRSARSTTSRPGPRRAAAGASPRRARNSGPGRWLVGQMATTGAPSATQEIAEEAVREALRRFQRARSAGSEPAGAGPRTRRAGRARPGPSVCRDRPRPRSRRRDQELRRTLEAAYLGVRRNHEQTADALCLSRPVYFLRLRRALERVVPCALEQAGLAC